MSQTLGGQETDKYSYAAAISGNGRYVAWTTKAENMGPADTNNDEDAYVFDVETGTNTLVSHDSGGQAVGGRATGISDNGKIVGAHLGLRLARARRHRRQQRGLRLQRGHRPGEAHQHSASRVGGRRRGRTTSISANGRYVAFVAFPLDDLSHAQVYLYDRQTRQSTAIGVKPDGSAANGGSGDPNVSRSGNYVGFCSAATDLVPGDNNGNTCDIFLWSRS